MRELDSMIAQHVMGWKAAHGFEAPAGLGAQHGKPVRWWLNARGEYAHDDSWHPSTSISDAWRVVERMRELGWMFELYSLNHTSGFASRWTVHFYANVRAIKQADAIAAPEAICLAALRALGVRVEGEGL